MHDDVGCERRPVHETRDGTSIDAGAVEHVTDPLDDPAARIVRSREDLSDGDTARAVGQDNVGERTADVDTDEVGVWLGHGRCSAIRSSRRRSVAG